MSSSQVDAVCCQTCCISSRVPHLCVCSCLSHLQVLALPQFSGVFGLLFYHTLSEMCLQSHSAHAVLCVPSLARLQMNYICPKVNEDTAAFASVLARWVILPKQKGAAPPSHCHWLRGIMLCMKHENPLHQVFFRGKSSPEVICGSLLDFSFVFFWSFSCMFYHSYLICLHLC